MDTDTLGSGSSRGYAYTTRDHSLAVLGIPAEGVAIIYVRRRELGVVDGVRVGDTCDSVLKRWGPPHSGDGQVAQWIAGRWLVSARCNETGRVWKLAVANVG